VVPEPLRPDPALGAGEPGERRLPRIPGYRLEGILGRGATGVVYRARQLSVDRPVALKVLNPELGSAAGGGRAARRLEREARTAARLAHPNIITAIDMGEQDGTWWYAMELVEGESMADRLQRGPLAERAALKLFLPLCEALVHLSEATS
jgi:serine/threonine-protein kinase